MWERDRGRGFELGTPVAHRRWMSARCPQCYQCRHRTYFYIPLCCFCIVYVNVLGEHIWTLSLHLAHNTYTYMHIQNNIKRRHSETNTYLDLRLWLWISRFSTPWEAIHTECMLCSDMLLFHCLHVNIHIKHVFVFKNMWRLNKNKKAKHAALGVK